VPILIIDEGEPDGADEQGAGDGDDDQQQAARDAVHSFQPQV
jgi:hypothetical protein